MARRGLGRGLDALIPRPGVDQTGEDRVPAAPAPSDQTDRRGVVELPVDRIEPSPWQPRRTLDETRLQELADSIQEQGLLQPVLVRQKDDGYELVAGERRWRAVQRLAWTEVPALILEASDARMRELALVENLQRADLNPMETAFAFQALQGDHGLTHEQIAGRLGISRAHVTNTLRLMELPEEIKELVASGTLSAGHARALLSLPEGLSQMRLAQRAVAEGLSVRAVERIAAGRTPARPGKPAQPAAAAPDPAVQDLEERLRDHLGTKVTIADRKGKGTITIEYYSRDDAARILERLGLGESL